MSSMCIDENTEECSLAFEKIDLHIVFFGFRATSYRTSVGKISAENFKTEFYESGEEHFGKIFLLKKPQVSDSFSDVEHKLLGKNLLLFRENDHFAFFRWDFEGKIFGLLGNAFRSGWICRGTF